MGNRRPVAVASIIAFALTALALLSTASAAPAMQASLPLKDPAGLARAWQKNINKKWDSAGRCRVVTRYAVRCAYTTTDAGRITQVFSKVGTHRLRTAMTIGGVGPIVRVTKLKPTSLLYPYV